MLDGERFDLRLLAILSLVLIFFAIPVWLCFWFVARTDNIKSFKHRFKKRMRFIWHTEKQHISDFVIFLSVTLGAFLPVRLVYYTYFSHHVGYNLGVLSAIAITMLLLVKSGILGFVGRAYERQMKRIIFGKTFRKLFFASIFIFGIYGSFLIANEYGEFHLQTERRQLFAWLVITDQPPYTMTDSLAQMNLLPTMTDIIEMQEIMNNPQQYAIWFDHTLHPLVFFPILFNMINISNGAWVSHFSAVYVLEEVEALALFGFYRIAYKSKSKGDAWHKIPYYDNFLLGNHQKIKYYELYPKSIKKFAKAGKKYRWS